MTAPQQFPYPPQFPQAPAAPAAPQYPQQFAPPQPPYPAQAYPQQYAPPQQYPAQPPAPPLATGTLDEYYNQPSTGGGKSLSFEQPGTSYVGIVTRAIGNGDIQQQTDTQGRPQTFRDGRPKFVMRVPLQIQPNAQYPDGLAQWYVKGAARDELVRAMAEAGAPQGPPEAGAVVQVTFTGTRSSGPGMNPTKLFQVAYRRPDGAAPAPVDPAAITRGVELQRAQQPIPTAQPPLPPAPAPQFAPPTAPPAAPAAVPQQPPAAPPAAPPPLAELNPEQQALLAKLTGAQPPA